MAQTGDTITYTYNNNKDGNNDLIPHQEDVSSVDVLTIKYVDGAGGVNSTADGGFGGSVNNVTVDVSSQSNIYIWVASQITGRYTGGGGSGGNDGGGSSEIAFADIRQSDSPDADYIVAVAGGGAGGNVLPSFSGPDSYYGGGAGARGGVGGSGSTADGGGGEGVSPPLGGDGGDADSTTQTAGGDGEGVVNTSLAEVIDAGSTTTGGGSGPDTNGEVRISYGPDLEPPDPPSNLSAEVQ